MADTTLNAESMQDRGYPYVTALDSRGDVLLESVRQFGTAAIDGSIADKPLQRLLQTRRDGEVVSF
jgi:hypothetical protein